MPLWLQILLGVLGGTSLLSLITRDIYTGIKGKSKKYRDYVREERKALYKEAAEEVVEPIVKKYDARFDKVEGRLDKVEENSLLTREGMQSELRHDIRNSCRRCIAQGYRTEDDVSEVDALHKSYEKVGISNGLTNTLYDKFNKLELVPNDYKPVKKPVSKGTPKRKVTSVMLPSKNKGTINREGVN